MIGWRPARLAFAAILLVAALLRAAFFIGLVSGDPQDDGIYYSQALAIYASGGNNLDRFRGPPPNHLYNPIDQFPLRPMVIYPVAAAFFLFGPGEVAATLWAFLCSLVTAGLVYRIGTLVDGRSTGLLAALLCAFYPLEVINATRILSDVQVGMFAALALLLVLEGFRRDRASLFALAGAAVAGAYLANARGLIVLLVLTVCLGVEGFFARRPRPQQAPLLLAAGFAAVFAVEAAVYSVRTGDPLLSYHVQSGASHFKYLNEPVADMDWGPILIRYTNGEPLDLLRAVLGLTHRPDQFGLFFWLFFASAIYCVVKRRALLLVAVAAALCVYLEFGPVGLAWDGAAGKLHYLMVFKQDRFLLTVSAPLLVLSAIALQALGARTRVALVAVLVILSITSFSATASTRSHYRGGLQDLRTLSRHVAERPEVTFFGDLWAVDHLRIFSGHRAQNLRVLTHETRPEDLRGACVILGGSRGVELLADYVESRLPPFARDVLVTGRAPEGWRLVEQIPGPRTAQRRHDAVLYCVE